VSEEEAKPKKSKAMLFGIVGALVLGGGGAFATYSGMVSLPFGKKGQSVVASITDAKDEIAYVKLDPILIDLGRGGRSGQLRITLIVETTDSNANTVEDSKYRITDTLYSFLRAIRQEDLRDPARTDMLRSRILRRVLLETPPDAVSDVLISEFVVL
jgi:flagellar FliL protein